MAGLFITFEGGEGVGKTTQIKLLAEKLTEMGARVTTTREPGGTPAGEAIRGLILSSDFPLDPMSETLLFFAGRLEHWKQVIKPALDTGGVVVCDRFTDSTRVYQCSGRGMKPAAVEQIKSAVLGGIEPDMTFILDMDENAGMARARSRAGDAKADRYESLGPDFHARIRQGFLAIAHDNPDRCAVLDATETAEQIAARIWAVVKRRVAS